MGKDAAVPLPNVRSATLAKVIEYCVFRSAVVVPGMNMCPVDVAAWEANFVKLEKSALFELMLVRLATVRPRCATRRTPWLTRVALQAANYLHCLPLLKLIGLTVANMIKGASMTRLRHAHALNALLRRQVSGGDP
jgi:S-phase kinase-associated protein 1